MKTILLLICVVAAAPCVFGQDRITVDQLEQRLAADHNRSDKHLAHRLEDLQLTQRLSTVRRERFKDELPGPESRAQLLAVSDLSEVLDLPPSEILTDPAPSMAEQQQMVALAVGSSKDFADPLLDFDATANITRFRNLKYFSTAHTAPISIVEPVPLELSHGIDAITYRQGRLFTTQTSSAWAPADALKAGAENWDGLYALLNSILRDMHDVQREWVGWEHGPAGNLAVFRFSVDENHSHVPIRTLIDPSSKRGYNGTPGYHAEIAFAPATGAVYRFVLRAVLAPGLHVSRADVVAEFAPVTVDGKSFLAPLRTVTIGVTESLVGLYNRSQNDFDWQSTQEIRPVIHLADVEFTAYQPGQSRPPAVSNPAFLAAAVHVMRQRVTVEQFEELVADLRGHDDHEVAHRLEQLELTERLTPDRYARLRVLFTGKASSEALRALYDLSAFNDLPQNDLAPGNPPDSKRQGEIIGSAVQFVASVTHKMPDLFASRLLARFQDLEVVRGSQQPLNADFKPLRLVDESGGTVHFRDGKEVVESESKNYGPKTSQPGLDTWGIFGPFLEMVMTDVLNSRIGFSHWEHGPSGPLAVFRYSVPQQSSHYDVRFCCYLAVDGLPSNFASKPGYHGELAVDPNTGAILRLVLKADLRSDTVPADTPERSPVPHNDVLVEYGANDIVDKQYVCPMRTVSVMTTWTLGSQGPLQRTISKAEGKRAAKKALALMEFSRVNAINEANFSDYHVFRSEMRIVSDPQ